MALTFFALVEAWSRRIQSPTQRSPQAVVPAELAESPLTGVGTVGFATLFVHILVQLKHDGTR